MRCISQTPPADRHLGADRTDGQSTGHPERSRYACGVPAQSNPRRSGGDYEVVGISKHA
ncbi:MAG: hypothetical protein IJX47_04680 [Clostridia bacterium]|nr:hypothetical protein [Clostridia bacterium]